MPSKQTDKDWEYFGRTDPYWAVLTHEEFRQEKLTPEALEKFFRSGEQYVENLLGAIHRHFDQRFSPATALDFGCGVGRLLIPLARRCQQAVGVDVSERMLKEAETRCRLAGLSNVRLVRGDDAVADFTEQFDLINSYIVLQHIPVPRGEAIVKTLLQRLRDGGVAALHFKYATRLPRETGWVRRVLWRTGFTQAALALRSLGTCWLGPTCIPPFMQMNEYNLNSIFALLQAEGIRRLHVELTDHGGALGLLLIMQKQPGDRYLV